MAMMMRQAKNSEGIKFSREDIRAARVQSLRLTTDRTREERRERAQKGLEQRARTWGGRLKG
jgi:hypothetical protein